MNRTRASYGAAVVVVAGLLGKRTGSVVQDANVSIYVDWQQSGPRKSYRIDFTVPIVQELVDKSAAAPPVSLLPAVHRLSSGLGVGAHPAVGDHGDEVGQHGAGGRLVQL